MLSSLFCKNSRPIVLSPILICSICISEIVFIFWSQNDIILSKFGVEKSVISSNERCISTICLNVLIGLWLFFGSNSKNSIAISSANGFTKIISMMVFSGVFQGFMRVDCTCWFHHSQMSISTRCESHWMIAIFLSCSILVVSMIRIFFPSTVSRIFRISGLIGQATATLRSFMAHGPKRKCRFAIAFGEVVITPAKLTISGCLTTLVSRSCMIFCVTWVIGTMMSCSLVGSGDMSHRLMRSWECWPLRPWIVAI